MFTEITKKVFFSFLLFFSLLANISFCSEIGEEYFLPEHHWLYARLDKIFAYEDCLVDEDSFELAGFSILYHQKTGMKVARHPLLPGYLVKVYLHSRQGNDGLQGVVDRCKRDENI